MISIERLKDLLWYDPVTGIFTNRTSRHHSAKAGEVAGSKSGGGYIQLSLDGQPYLAHRMAWFYMTGTWPAGLIDHRDGNRSNNAWMNLRDEPRLINQQNLRRATKANGSGLLGAFRVGNRYKSSIRVKGKVLHLGFFATAIEAHQAYVAAKRLHHPGCTI